MWIYKWRDDRKCSKPIYAWGSGPMVENIQTPCNTCIDLEDVSKGTKKMAKGKQPM